MQKFIRLYKSLANTEANWRLENIMQEAGGSNTTVGSWATLHQGPNLTIFATSKNLACYKKIYWLKWKSTWFFKKQQHKGWSRKKKLVGGRGGDDTFLPWHP